MSRTTRSKRVFSPYNLDGFGASMEPAALVPIREDCDLPRLIQSAFERADRDPESIEDGAAYVLNGASGPQAAAPGVSTASLRQPDAPGAPLAADESLNAPDAPDAFPSSRSASSSRTDASKLRPAPTGTLHASPTPSQLRQAPRTDAPEPRASPNHQPLHRNAPNQLQGDPASANLAHLHYRLKRREHRKEKAAEARYPKYVVREGVAKKYTKPAKVVGDAAAESFSHASGSWVGLPGLYLPIGLQELERLLRRGFRLVPWDGIEHTVVVDQVGRIVAVLAGRPKTGDWQGTCTRAYDSLDKVRESLRLPDDVQHRRGRYPSVNVGISYGRGQKQPMNLPTPEPVRQLLQDADVRRIAGFANSVFAVNAPKLYKSYEGM
ncbi:hypothetical protein BV25DRAFT_1921411, partial [Artomyces pyxidatus]